MTRTARPRRAILGPGQHLLQHFNLLAIDLACNLSIHWISSHSKVKGNEKVDELAKDAAAGKSSRAIDLPPILKRPLPTSASAFKQEFLRRIKRKWAAKWTTSDRSRRMELLDESFPFNNFRKHPYLLSTKQASLLLQIRSGRFPLNSYLHKIGKSETDTCQACADQENDIRCKETVDHFIFECTAYDHEGDILIEEIQRKHLFDIMANTEYMKSLVNFVNSTGRLKKP
jgi:hypothetical protein